MRALLLLFALVLSHIQDTQLPADLIYATTITEAGEPHKAFVRVDAVTLQTSLFYVDDATSIRPLSWSPQLNYLAFLRYSSGGRYWEVCLLTRDGTLHTCLEDRIVDHFFSYRGAAYNVTWSPDERHIYFVADYATFNWQTELHESDPGEPEIWSASLLEADVQTGQTVRTIYQTPAREEQPPPLIYWSPDLRYIRTVVPGQGLVVIDLLDEASHELPGEIEGVGSLSYCPWFSPHGSYLSAVVYGESRTALGLAIIDAHGTIIQVIGADRLAEIDAARPGCPVWHETGVYFVDGVLTNGGYDEHTTHSLLAYSLAEDRLARVKQIDPPEAADPAARINRPGQRIKPAASDPRYVALSFTNRIFENEFRVLTPDGTWLRFLPADGRYPIWVEP